MEQKFGVQNTKKAVKLACGFTRQAAIAMEDKKFQLHELMGFFDEVSEIPGVVKSLPEIRNELSEFSPEERKEVHDYIVQEFDIPNDKVEMAIEHSIGWTISTYALYEMWKSIKAAA